MKFASVVSSLSLAFTVVACGNSSSKSSPAPVVPVEYSYFSNSGISCQEYSQQYVDVVFKNDAEKMATFKVEKGSCPQEKKTQIDGEDKTLALVGYCVYSVFGPSRTYIYEKTKYETDRVQECRDNQGQFVAK